MTPDLVFKAMTHARASYPDECCGVLVKGADDHADYIPCRNIGPIGQFEIHPQDWAHLEDMEQIIGIVHSHHADPRPSNADIKIQRQGRYPWWIVTPEGEWRRIGAAPLEGRQFAWGVQDCYTLLQDALGCLPEKTREYQFWLNGDPFEEGIKRHDFREVVGVPEPDDVLLFSIRGGGRINHCGLYLGDGRMLHHLPGRLSVREPVGAWVRCLEKIVRRAR